MVCGQMKSVPVSKASQSKYRTVYTVTYSRQAMGLNHLGLHLRSTQDTVRIQLGNGSNGQILKIGAFYSLQKN